MRERRGVENKKGVVEEGHAEAEADYNRCVFKPSYIFRHGW